ncbi:50S ribosomal protein L40e [Candidatus Woesearchaeota archaeon]|nr:50S ribosomal protein L40e [Candidatus Woesearchaeota archaeon]
MVKFPEAEARLFHNKFVCRQCKANLRAPNMKVLQGKVLCRKCGSRALRPVRKK